MKEQPWKEDETHESSREYWRNPRRFATFDELHISKPEYYAQEGLGALSDWVIENLCNAGLEQRHKVLEIGSNCGRNLQRLFDKGFTNAFGVEISPEAVDYAWVAHPQIADRIMCSEAQPYLAMQRSCSFDAIFTQGVLMHVPPTDDYLFEQMARVARYIISVNEVEGAGGILVRHKFARNYREVFEDRCGWKQVFEGAHANAITRVFRREEDIDADEAD